MFSLLLTAACVQSLTYQDYLRKKNIITEPQLENFQHCYGYGCRVTENVSLSDNDWGEIKAAFSVNKNAPQERQNIANVIALFEQKVGALTGTEADKAGTYANIGRYNHDCVDESLNTTIYLSLLEQNGLLKFHTLSAPTARIPFISGRLGPHQSAVITETKTGQRYAVDSWFHDNGHPPEIVTIEEWKNGWQPE